MIVRQDTGLICTLPMVDKERLLGVNDVRKKIDIAKIDRGTYMNI